MAITSQEQAEVRKAYLTDAYRSLSMLRTELGFAQGNNAHTVWLAIDELMDGIENAKKLVDLI